MNLKSFEQAIKNLDLSAHPNIQKNWIFKETENCFIASCGSNARLLRGKGYSIYCWKEDPEKLQLAKMPEKGQGTILEEFRLAE